MRHRLLRRCLPVLICASLLLVPVAFAGRASAVAYDYNDLNPVVVVDGDNDLVTLNFDVSKSALSFREQLTSGSIVIPAHSYDWLSVYPLGYTSTGNSLAWNALDGFNIPSGTVFTLGLRLDFDEQLSQAGPSNILFESYIDLYPNIPTSMGSSSNRLVGSVVSAPVGNSFYVNMQVTYMKPAFPTDYLVPWIYVKTIATDRACTITVTTCRMTFSISSLYRQQMLTGKTNKLLDEVKSQLEANGQKLDDIIEGNQQIQDNQDEIMNRPVSPVAPTGAGSVDDYGKLEDQILQDMSGGFGSASEMQQSAAQLLYQYRNGFTFLTWVVNGFTDIPVLKNVLYISLCIGIFALLVGAVFSSIRGFGGSDHGGGKK